MLTIKKAKSVGCELCDGEGCVICDANAMAMALGFTLEPVEVEEIDAEEEDLTNEQEFSCQVATPVIKSRFRTKKGREVLSPYDNNEALALLHRSPADFAKKLLNDHKQYKRLFPDQWAWVHILAIEQAQNEGKPVPVIQGYKAGWVKSGHSGTKLHAMMMLTFNETKLGTRFTFFTDNGRIELTVSKSEKNFKRIWIANKTKEEGANTLYGSINTNGEMWFAPDCPVWVKSTMALVCGNPADALKKFGLQSGRCCICRLALTDSVSLRCGYGPVCAKKYNLPYA